ncbi:unnamed protein product [Notodromas monacha]|uniref:Uncharacterized protein n=1 Tax=Notodromas monacha TaxID=399045 RepID=A0A7R9GBX3_9CRUS|nr:unnamed protein product [Notodromas monacha]CAG0916983.1 unnamed protein product [Notodromas monacha]
MWKGMGYASLPEETRHDTGELYRKLSLSDLRREVHVFDWDTYFNASLFIKIDEDEPIVTYSLPYLQRMSKIISKTDRRIVHNLVVWHLIKELMGVMPDGYQEVLAEFKRSLLGINAHRGLWKTCVDITNKRMGMAVGAMYIRETFNHQSKETALEMIHTLREAFNELLEDNIWMDDETRRVAREKADAMNERIDNIWMDDETRRVAREKADAMNERIGYPDMLENKHELEAEFHDLDVHPSKFLGNIFAAMRYEGHRIMKKLREPVRKDRWSTLPAVVNAFYDPHKNDIGLGPIYGLLDVHPSKFLGNIFAAMRYEGHRIMKKLREPVRKDRWSTLPAVVNAFYDPHKNDIVFPAGILQPNFYNPDAPNSLNYGGIGVVIGHEITHGFDDKGRQYDKDGNMKEWWNDETIRAFRRRALCFVDTYSTYNVPLVNMTINGMMTQGENIADNGGLKQAFRAYNKWVRRNGPEPALPGLQHLTHEQLFFLNFAQIWCGSMTPEDAISKIRSAVHSPAPIRVLGPLSNSYDFAAAYSCRRGSRMNPPAKCSVW